MRKLIIAIIIMGILALGSNAIADIKSGDTCQLKSNHIVAFMYHGGLIKFVKLIKSPEVLIVVPINQEQADQLFLAVKTDWQDGFVVMIEEQRPEPEKPVKHYMYAPLSALRCN